jgi:Putative auto-transporter adhesin, head GIN domain
MMYRWLAVVLLVGVLAAAALARFSTRYSWAPGVRGVGAVATQRRSVPPFRRVRTKGDTDVTVTVGPQQAVAVEAQPNVAALVTTDVQGDELVISSDKPYSTDRTVVVHVTLPDLEGITIDGSANATVHGVRGAAIELAIQGSGDITATGSVERLTYTSSGSGDAHLDGLSANDVVVKIAGSGSARVAARDTLDVVISGSGDVSYRGAPHLTQTIRGSGSITQI